MTDFEASTLPKAAAMTGDPLLSLAEIVEYTGRAKSTVYASWWRRKLLPEPDEWSGRSPLWRRSTFEAWHDQWPVILRPRPSRIDSGGGWDDLG